MCFLEFGFAKVMLQDITTGTIVINPDRIDCISAMPV
jgi:hypothetical protein